MLVTVTPSISVAAHSILESGGEVDIVFHFAELLTKVTIPWVSLEVCAA